MAPMSDMIEIIDQSIRDFAVSDDAMRWAPERIKGPPKEAFILVPVLPSPERIRLVVDAANTFFGQLAEQLKPVIAAMGKLMSQLPEPPQRGKPPPLAADGAAYRRRCLARRRRR
jgi:hypothetical protein